MEYEEWLTVPQVARDLGVDPSTVRRWIRERHLRAQAITVTGHTIFRIRRSDYLAFRSRVHDTLDAEWERG